MESTETPDVVQTHPVVKPPMTHVNIRIPEKHMRALRDAAEEMELNISDVIRLAVQEWVEKRD